MILTFLWFFIGGLVLVCSFYGYNKLVHANTQAQQVTHQIQRPEKSLNQSNTRNEEASFDASKITPVTPEQYAKAQLNYEKIVNQWGIGSIYIPSVSIQTKILAGMTNENLMVGVGTYYPDQQLGKGNYVALAHNLVQGGGSLGTLNQVREHDTIYATDFSNVYEYITTKSGVVDYSQGTLLDVPEKNEEALLTLMRCEGGLNTPNRAIVQGEYVRSYPADNAPKEVLKGLGLVKETFLQAIEASRDNQTNESKQNSSVTDNQKESQEQENKKPAKKQTKPSFSFLDKTCIDCYLFVQRRVVLLLVIYILLFDCLILWFKFTGN